ncbi:hypothetical protein AB0B85_01800 [Micromonospora sp. NPDC049044]|uniref:hypothetical protein n=1 Tax=unclassified Micromonospora TaxID=2617518 RepID=UPI0033C01534
MISQTFDTGGTRLDDPVTTAFLPAVVASGGLAFRPGALERPGNTYSAMIERLSPAFAELRGPVDLVVLAYATPDAVPGAVAGPLATAVLPGNPSAFAVTDQGVAAPFTALALAELYAARTGLERIVVLLLDQASFPYEVPDSPAVRVDGDAVVVLVLERPGADDGRGGYEIQQDSGVPAAEFTERIGRLWKQLADDEDTPVLFGPGVDPAWSLPISAVDVRHVAPGQPGTGLWREAAARHSGTARGTVVLIDLDPSTGDLSGCRLDTGAPPR